MSKRSQEVLDAVDGILESDKSRSPYKNQDESKRNIYNQMEEMNVDELQRIKEFSEKLIEKQEGQRKHKEQVDEREQRRRNAEFLNNLDSL